MITQYNNSKSEVPLHPPKLSNPCPAVITSTGLMRANLSVIDTPKAEALEIDEARKLAIGNGLYGEIALVIGTTAIEPDGFVM